MRHDRVYALLGMLQDGCRKSLSAPDFSKPAQEIFRIATIVMILESQLLYCFIWRDVVLEQSEETSWVCFSDFELQYRFCSQFDKLDSLWHEPIKFEIGDHIFTKQSIYHGTPIAELLPETMENPMLVTKGFIFDKVTKSFPHLCPDTFQAQLFAAYDALRKHSSKASQFIEDIFDEIWLTISLYDNLTGEKQSEEYRTGKLSLVILFSRWALEDFGITGKVIEENKLLEDPKK
jgi:hypothetical protein